MTITHELTYAIIILTSKCLPYTAALHEKRDIILWGGAPDNELLHVSVAGIETLFLIEDLVPEPGLAAGQYTLHLNKAEAVAALNHRRSQQTDKVRAPHEESVPFSYAETLCLVSNSEIFAVSTCGQALFFRSPNGGLVKYNVCLNSDGTLDLIDSKRSMVDDYNYYIFESLGKALAYVTERRTR